jgi:hypothetical protein
MLASLGSVLLISENAGLETFAETVSTFQPSFRDFLIDPQRCSDERFVVKPTEHQQALAHRCLQLLNKHLRYDICEIRNPGWANDDIQDLSARLATFVPEAVRYACVFWPVHLLAGSSLTQSASETLLVFCTDHLSHWLEALSVLGELSSACKNLPRIVVWCQVRFSPAR